MLYHLIFHSCRLFFFRDNPFYSRNSRILQELYTYYIAHPEALPQDFQPQLTFEGLPRVVCDYIAGMTDKYAMYKYDELFIPTGWQGRG